MRSKTKAVDKIDPVAIANETKKLKATEKKVKGLLDNLSEQNKIAKTLEEASEIKKASEKLLEDAKAEAMSTVEEAKKVSQKEAQKVLEAKKRLVSATKKLQAEKEQHNVDSEELARSLQAAVKKEAELEAQVDGYRKTKAACDEMVRGLKEALKKVLG